MCVGVHWEGVGGGSHYAIVHALWSHEDLWGYKSRDSGDLSLQTDPLSICSSTYQEETVDIEH
jgi:hypothetical protein